MAACWEREEGKTGAGLILWLKGRRLWVGVKGGGAAVGLELVEGEDTKAKN